VFRPHIRPTNCAHATAPDLPVSGACRENSSKAGRIVDAAFRGRATHEQSYHPDLGEPIAAGPVPATRPRFESCPRCVDNPKIMDTRPQRPTEAALLKDALATSEAAFGLRWRALNKPAGRRATAPDALLELQEDDAPFGIALP
jgi:hypothetical protein